MRRDGARGALGGSPCRLEALPFSGLAYLGAAAASSAGILALDVRRDRVRGRRLTRAIGVTVPLFLAFGAVGPLAADSPATPSGTRSRNQFGRLANGYQGLTGATVLIHGTALTASSWARSRRAEQMAAR